MGGASGLGKGIGTTRLGRRGALSFKGPFRGSNARVASPRRFPGFSKSPGGLNPAWLGKADHKTPTKPPAANVAIRFAGVEQYLDIVSQLGLSKNGCRTVQGEHAKYSRH